MKSIHTPYFRVIHVEFSNQTRLHQVPIATQGDHFGIEENTFVYLILCTKSLSDGSRFGTRNLGFGRDRKVHIFHEPRSLTIICLRFEPRSLTIMNFLGIKI